MDPRVKPAGDEAHCGADMATKLIHGIAFIALATLLVLPARAQAPKGTPPPGGREGSENEEAVSIEQSAVFDVRPVSGTLKETLSPINAANLRKAHEKLESGTMIGKLVLKGWS